MAFEPEEDGSHDEEEAQTGRDRRQASAGRRAGVARPERGRRHALIAVTEVTYYRWRQEFGGLKSDQVKRLKDLETENTRLRRAVADLTLDKLILKEAASGNF